MSTTDWEHELYDTTFDKAYKALQQRRLTDPLFTQAVMQGILEHLYIQQGLDQYGRGRMQDISIDATIAAHEAYVHAWDTEKTNPPKTTETSDKL